MGQDDSANATSGEVTTNQVRQLEEQAQKDKEALDKLLVAYQAAENDIEARSGVLGFLADPIEQSEGRLDGGEYVAGSGAGKVELARIMKEGQKQREQQLAVGVTA